MGQEEIIEVLEKTNKWMLVGEIIEVLHENRCQINRILRALYKYGEVLRKEAAVRHRRVYLWRAKDEDAKKKDKIKVDKSGYIQIHMPDHSKADSKGYIMEHRLIVEKKIGRYLRPKEVVHHLNEDKSDNKIENLMLFETQRKHMQFHNKVKQFGYTTPVLRQIEERWKKY